MKSSLLIVPMLMASAAFGQGPGFRGNATNGTASTLTPAQIAQEETNRLTRFFTLTSSQQSTVLGILTTADTQIQSLQSQFQPLRANLVTAIKANNASQINSILMQISPVQEQIDSARAVAAGQIYATVLTTAQQAQIPNGLGPLLGGGGGGAGGGFRGR